MNKTLKIKAIQLFPFLRSVEPKEIPHCCLLTTAPTEERFNSGNFEAIKKTDPKAQKVDAVARQLFNIFKGTEASSNLPQVLRELPFEQLSHTQQEMVVAIYQKDGNTAETQNLASKIGNEEVKSQVLKGLNG